MRHHDDRVFFLQFQRKVLDLRGRDRVKRRRRFIQQNHFRIDRQRTCNAQTLLLSAGHSERTLFQPVFHLIPDRRIAQGFFHDLIQLCLGTDAVRARSVCDIVVNAHRERIRLLEYHADTPAQQIHVHAAVDVFPVEQHLSCDLTSLYQIVHAVQAF